ncbi:putative transcription factor C2H2 family [Dioscorea sansibarensis]
MDSLSTVKPWELISRRNDAYIEEGLIGRKLLGVIASLVAEKRGAMDGSTTGGDGNAGAFAGAIAPTPKGYAMSGKIMLTAIVVLFSAVLAVLFIHLYARWYLLRRNAARRERRRRDQRGLIFAQAQAQGPTVAVKGLDPTVLKSLPVVIFSEEEREEEVECAVCLCAVMAGEKVRILPKCGHGFHIECIDMWFGSHATCPLCRAAVELVSEPPACAVEEGPSTSDTAAETGSKSPRSAIVMLRRLWSRDLRGFRSGEPTPELDLERGRSGVGET